MAEDGKELVASMGDDTPSAVLSETYRPLSHFFRQNFSQVTNPPIDSLREYRVMSLKTRFGNLKNVLDQDSSQTEIAWCWKAPLWGMRSSIDSSWTRSMRPWWTIDCTFEAGAGALRRALERIRAEAEDAVRSGAGCPCPDGSASGDRQGADADDPGDERRAFLADAKGAQDLLFPERAVGGMRRSPLLRRSDRLRGNGGQCLPCRGFHCRPDLARADRRNPDRGRGPLPQAAIDAGPSEDHVEDGDFDASSQSYRGGAGLRGGRALGRGPW